MRHIFGMVTTAASGEYTAEALSSFFRHTPLADDDEFHLIDNDGAVNPAALAAAYPRVSLIRNPRPFSYAENANQILDRAAQRGADAFYMNNDIIFTPDWLDPLCLHAEAVFAPTGNQNFSYKTVGFELKPVMTLQDYRGHEAEFLHLVEQHCRTRREYAGAYKTNFFLVRIPPPVYRAVGGFDTGFGVAGGEDDDYCIRAYLKGFSVLVPEHSYLLHFGGRSTWGGPESLDQWRAREANFAAVFTRKWGPYLARFLLHRDPTVTAGDPQLARLEREAGIGGLFQELARRGGVAISPDLLWRPLEFARHRD